MKTIELLKQSLANEGVWFACLRVLKAAARAADRFIRSIPYFYTSLIKDAVTIPVNDYRLKIFLKDRGIARDLFVHHQREHLAKDLIHSHDVLRKGDIVLDIGANIGYYAIMESRLVGETGCVLAVEPSPKNFDLLNENIRLNSVRNIKTYNLAMGETNGKAEMYISNRSNWSRLVDKDLNDTINETVVLDISTVDEFIKDRPLPTFVRMDVEGYEINILRGMKKWMTNDNLTIFVEFHPHFMSHAECVECFDILKAAGFKLRKCLLNPCLEQNFAVRFAYEKLEELDNYTGKVWEMSIDDARDWVLTHDIKRMPHFLFTKKLHTNT